MAIPARLTVGDLAPDIALLNAAGQSVHLQDLWPQQPVLLSLLRHFG